MLRVLGREVVASREPPGRTPCLRRVVTLDDGRTAFVKQALQGDTAAWLRIERRLYEHLEGHEVTPRLLDFVDGDRPLLVLEDSSDAHWPPPWREGDVDAVLETLAVLRAITPPADIPAADASRYHLWPLVAADPAAMLSLGVCSAAWLENALPVLEAASAGASFEGDGLVHLDVRSDNICIRDGRALLIDWNWAGRGGPSVDVSCWLPSLASEGGPQPEEVDASADPRVAALLAGWWAAMAGLPEPPNTSGVRAVQLSQLRVALPWAARLHGLPPPG